MFQLYNFISRAFVDNCKLKDDLEIELETIAMSGKGLLPLHTTQTTYTTQMTHTTQTTSTMQTTSTTQAKKRKRDDLRKRLKAAGSKALKRLEGPLKAAGYELMPTTYGELEVITRVCTFRPLRDEQLIGLADS